MRRVAAVTRLLPSGRLLLFFFFLLFVALVLLAPTASNAQADPHPGLDEVAGTATEQETPSVEPTAPDVPDDCAPPEAPADPAATQPSGDEPVPVKPPALVSPRSSTPPPPARPSSKALTVATESAPHARRTATAPNRSGNRGDQPRVTPTQRSGPSDTPRESQTHRDGGDTLTNAAGGFAGRAPSIGHGDPNLILTLGLIAVVTAILITVLVRWSKLFPGNTA